MEIEGPGTRSVVHVPTEVWGQIAQHMSLEQWARIAGICRASQSVQPSGVCMVLKSSSAVDWLQKHWRCARWLDLDVEPKNTLPFPVFRPVDLDQLEYLRLKLDDGWGHAAAVFLARLLSSSPRLKLLEVQMGRRSFSNCIPLPHFSALQHLSLQFTRFADATICSIQEFQQLRTLKMSGTDNGNRCALCSPLDLGSLRSLTHVACEYVIFKDSGLCLPAGCLLYVHSNMDPDQPDKEWWMPNAVKGQLDSFEFIEWAMHARHEVPAFLSDSRCRVLYWGDADLGRYRAPASISGPLLGSLRELYMEGTNISIRLSRALQLDALHLCAINLTVTCEDAAALAERLKSVSFMSRNLAEAGVFQVAQAMAELGKAMIPVTGAETVHLEEEDPLDNRFPLYSGIYYRVHYARHRNWPCKCGACLACLGAN